MSLGGFTAQNRPPTHFWTSQTLCEISIEHPSVGLASLAQIDIIRWFSSPSAFPIPPSFCRPPTSFSIPQRERGYMISIGVSRENVSAVSMVQRTFLLKQNRPALTNSQVNFSLSKSISVGPRVFQSDQEYFSPTRSNWLWSFCRATVCSSGVKKNPQQVAA